MATRYYNLENEAKAYLKACTNSNISPAINNKTINDFVIQQKNNSKNPVVLPPNYFTNLYAWYSADFGLKSPSGNAVNFISSSLQTLSAASNSSLQVGGTPFTFTFWYKHTAGVTSGSGVIIKGTSSTSGGEFETIVTANLMYFRVRTSANVTGPQIAGTTVMSIGNWYFIEIGFDSTTSKIFIRVNNGGYVESVATSVYTGTNPLEFGRSLNPTYLTGAIDEVSFWKRTLTDAERLFVYNTGFGRSYSEYTASLKTSLISYWSMDETSGTRYDSFGTNNLTSNNNVGYIQGSLSIDTTTSGQQIRSWADRSGNSRNLDQTTSSAQPLLSGTGLLFNGISQNLRLTGLTLPRPLTLYIVTVPITTLANDVIFHTTTSGNGLQIRQTGSSLFTVSNGNTVQITTIQNASNLLIARKTLTGSSIRLAGASETVDSVATLDGVEISVGGQAGSSGFANAIVREICLYTTDHDWGTQNKIYNYLACKWGISV